MATKEGIDTLLLHLNSLEQLAKEVRGEEIIPALFFKQAFDGARQILNDLCEIEQARFGLLETQLDSRFDQVKKMSEQLAVEDERIKALIAANEPAVKEPVEVILEETPVQPVAVAAEPEPAPEPEPNPKPEVVAEPVLVPECPAAPNQPRSLKEVYEKQTLTDFKKSFSLNDRFLFKKELFGGNEEKMTRVINDLNEMTSLSAAQAYIGSEMAWDKENAYVVDFISRLERRFN